MKTSHIVPTENLKQEPYASILCYPKASEAELESRLEELLEQDVTAVEFSGKTSAFNLPVLGKGFVGIVLAAHLNGQRVALKIRRVDANRLGLQHEAQMLAKANEVQVGPKLIDVSRNFLLMQLIEGSTLPEWLNSPKKKAHVRSVLNEVLKHCWRLDNVGLDHGELSKAPKHLLVDKHQKPWIVDFESASVNRKPANVTSVCQFLFTSGGGVSRAVTEVLGQRQREEIISALRSYKNDRAHGNFNRLVQICLSQIT